MERKSKESELVFDVIVRNYGRLEELNPSHALLGYLKDVSPKGFSWNEDRFNDFLTKFAGESHPGLDIGQIFGNYSSALSDAVMAEAVLISRRLKKLPADYTPEDKK